MITATGLGSGIDIEGLVTQLIAAERAPSDLQLSRESSELTVKLSAFGSLKSSVSTFQSALSDLNVLSNYSANFASSSNKEAVTISANSEASHNNYDIEVGQLAVSHALASTSFVDKDTTEIGTGTITIRFGTTDYNSGTDTYNSFTQNPESTVATIDIDSSNNTLEGIMEAINDADIGVNASIVNDGSGYRILFGSDKTGAENSIEISVSDDDGNNIDNIAGLSRLAFNSQATNVEQTRAATDASFTINGLTINSSENATTTAIPGVTLTLNQVTEEPVEIEVKQNKGVVISAVNKFISGYNQLNSTASQLTKYDASSGLAGILNGDFTVRSITGQIGNMLRNAVGGLTGDFTIMSELGITTDADGNLKLDNNQFNKVLESNPDDVLKIFTSFASGDDETITYNGSSDLTTVGDYSVEITALASSGYYAGTSVLPNFGGGGTVTIDNDNDNFSLEVNGVETEVLNITQGIYSSGEDLATEMQARINGDKNLRDAGVTVSVDYDSVNNNLTITSDSDGSTSSVNLLTVDTNSLANLGLDVGDGTLGTDVSGLIGGVAATGTGNILSAAEGSDAQGLSLVIGDGPLGSRGDITFTRGLAGQLDVYLEGLLDEKSSLENRLDTLKERQDRLNEKKEDMEIRWEKIEERYRRQYNAMDRLVATLQATGNFLESQLASLPKPNSIRNNS